VVIALGICLPFGSQIFDFLIAPANRHFPDGGGFIYTEVAEKFITNLKVGLFASVFLAAPFLFGQAWAFVAPGLYKHERRLALPFIVTSTLFFVAGAAFCYYGVLPWGMHFFLSLGTADITPQIKVAAYLRFVTRFILAMGLVFQMPLGIFFLARAGIVDAQGLSAFRKYAVVLSFVAAAVLTPPDPGTQVALALPMILLYELGILTARLWGRPKIGSQPAEA
jgi:sec-independent protein translocase protein TatC